MPPRDIGDTWIQDVRLPYQAVAEAVTTVDVIVGAQAAVTADVTLLEVDTGGTLKALASGTAVAKAAESLTSVAAVRIVTVTLLPTNAAFV